jgi:hypothetical protein
MKYRNTTVVFRNGRPRKPVEDITDRAKRYRAHAADNKPLGPINPQFGIYKVYYWSKAEGGIWKWWSPVPAKNKKDAIKIAKEQIRMSGGVVPSKWKAEKK